ncbi:D-alanyl-D-alanine carboxypeptidase [Halomonas sp. TRM85114]|uniref:SPOR domain-containing protein n=1 Tax=Halomonas jincaotanensis TaxID=2810616 RepID=UPI001BD20643|nr:SPOR domain-containing protein [Halomonas jincaotanensis]MBS9403472.1 D-alanyl-D-alanine carboxypeptidase [Halomonas jincaotanensis]
MTGLMLLISLALFTTAQAQAGNPRYAGIVIDADSQEILYADNADKLRYPASLTKMMTLYLLFEALEERSLSLNQPLSVSPAAAAMPATKLWLKPGDSIPVETALQALVVRSANDVAVVVAEALGGTHVNFARMMTDKARQLGMYETVFRNASGLPDAGQVTTARDMVILARHLMQDFPQYYPYFSRQQFTWRGKTHTGHNRLLKTFPGADGLKTGFIRASGFNVATSAVRDGRRLLTVVMGGFTAASRDEHTADLLNRSFVRAALADGNSWLASADISGGRLTSDAQGAPYIPAANEGQLASNSAAESDRLREVSSAFPPAPVVASVSTLDESSPGAIKGDAPASVFASPPQEQGSAGDPIHQLMTDVGNTEGVDIRSGGTWGVQVGAFSDANHARTLASRAADRLASQLANARIAVANAGDSGVYRARVVDLNESQAHDACRSLVREGMDCMVVQASL